jgi:hypothetical protein
MDQWPGNVYPGRDFPSNWAQNRDSEAGIFECGITTWIVARTGRDADWSKSLAFGTGFGAMEAHGAMTPQSGRNRLATVVPESPPSGDAGPLVMAVVERAGTLFVQMFSCVTIFGLRTRRASPWFILALVYKSAVDGVGCLGYRSAQRAGINHGAVAFGSEDDPIRARGTCRPRL